MTAYVLSAVFITLLGAAYVKGYDLVKGRSPEHLPQFYLIMATTRMLLVLTVVGLYVYFTDDKESSVRFSLSVLAMYAVMMTVTLSMRH